MLVGGRESLGVDLEIDNLPQFPIYFAVVTWKLQVQLEAPVSPCLPYGDRLCSLEQQAKISHSPIKVLLVRCLTTVTRKLTNTYGQEVAINTSHLVSQQSTLNICVSLAKWNMSSSLSS